MSAQIILFPQRMTVSVVPVRGGFEVWYRGGHLDHTLTKPIATFPAVVSANHLASRVANMTGRVAVHAEGNA